MARWSPIPLRLIVGYGFMQHGFAKLSRGPDAFAAILQAMGVPAPHIMAWLTILTELLGGVAVLLGAFVTIVSVPSPSVDFLAVNMRKDYLLDKRVRQAMLYAIDREAIVKAIHQGEAQVVNQTIIGPDWMGMPDLNMYKFDPNKSWELLKAANWDSSRALQTLYVPGTKERDAYMPIIQQQFKEVGITMEIVPSEAAEATRRAVRAWGLEVLCQDEREYSGSLTAVLMPEGHNADTFRKVVLENFDMSLGNGLGKVTEFEYSTSTNLMLAAAAEGTPPSLATAEQAAQSAREQAAAERKAARESGVLVQTGSRPAGSPSVCTGAG